MFTTAALLFACAQHAQTIPRAQLMQAFPARTGALIRSPKQNQAVILLHGLDLRDDGAAAAQPRFHYWQGSCSAFVRELSHYADVFSICYAQTTAVEDVARFHQLRHFVARIRRLGYERIVLVGHSAGGLVARHFVEDFPDAGVDAVIQIATPNGGAILADWGIRLWQTPRDQQRFVASLGTQYRQTLTANRSRRKIPAHVEFAVVVTHASVDSSSDTIVSRYGQWTRDLQLQCVPCYLLESKHNGVFRKPATIHAVAGLLKYRHPRWDRARVFRMRRRLGLLPQDGIAGNSR